MKFTTFLIPALASTTTLALDNRSPPYLKHLATREKLAPRQYQNITQKDCTYPTVQEIEKVWSQLTGGDYGHFFANFVGDVDWTIMFTQPLSGHYNNVTQFLTNGLFRLFDVAAGPAKFTGVNIAGGCENPWSIQETLVEAVAKNGRVLDQIVVWSTRWDTRGKIVEVRSYVDSYVTMMILHENEIWTNSSWRDFKPYLLPGPAGAHNLTQYLGYDPNTLPN